MMVSVAATRFVAACAPQQLEPASDRSPRRPRPRAVQKQRLGRLGEKVSRFPCPDTSDARRSACPRAASTRTGSWLGGGDFFGTRARACAICPAKGDAPPAAKGRESAPGRAGRSCRKRHSPARDQARPAPWGRAARRAAERSHWRRSGDNAARLVHMLGPG